MDESAEAFAAPDLAELIRADEVWAMPGCGWSQAERSMRVMFANSGGLVFMDESAEEISTL